jgi:hypothetical protein
MAAINPLQESLEIAASEGPLKWRCSPLVVRLEGKQALLEFGQGRKVVGGEDLSLNDGEVDLDLVEPTGVDGGVDEYGVGPLGAQPVNGLVATMGGAIVHNPEDATSGLVGFLAHDFTDQAIGRGNPVLDCTTSKESGTMNIPGGQVSPRTLTKILVLHAHRAVGGGGQSGVFPAPGLNAGFFIEGKDEVIRAGSIAEADGHRTPARSTSTTKSFVWTMQGVFHELGIAA